MNLLLPDPLHRSNRQLLVTSRNLVIDTALVAVVPVAAKPVSAALGRRRVGCDPQPLERRRLQKGEPSRRARDGNRWRG
jgi:hypothetical protein